MAAGNEQPAYTVSFSTDPTNQAMVVGGDSVTFDLNGHAYLLTDPGSTISVGTTTGSFGGSLTIMDGVVATTAANPAVRIGNNGVPGLLNISTGGQLLGPQIVVGGEGPGSLIVQGGGDLVGRRMGIGDFGSRPGTATVTGAGSGVVVEDLVVGGEFTPGTLNIHGGGRVECIEAALAPDVSAFVGAVNIDGVNSRFICSSILNIGYLGQGTMAVTGGGRVDCLAGFVGVFTTMTSTVTVGSNSQWIMADGLFVGFEGRGVLDISGGSLVQDTVGVVGGETAVGTVNIDGAGTRWLNSGSLEVGSEGEGTLSITGGGLVTCADGLIASRGMSDGLVTVAGTGSQWTIADSLSVGGDIEQGLVGGSGSLFIGPGGAVSVGSIHIFPDDSVDLQGGTLDASSITHAFDSTGQLLFHSGLLHVGAMDFSLLNQGGTLAPGHSAGNTTISGSYTQQAAGTMEIEIGGTIPGTQFDRVAVGSAADLGGALDLRLINGFAPSPDQTFVVLDAVAGISGGFANVSSGQRLTTSDGAGSFAVHYGDGSPFDPTQVVLSDFGVCIADFNGDGVVDTRDVLAFLNAWAYRDPSADCDGNGVIDTRDVLCFLNAWNAGC